MAGLDQAGLTHRESTQGKLAAGRLGGEFPLTAGSWPPRRQKKVAELSVTCLLFSNLQIRWVDLPSLRWSKCTESGQEYLGRTPLSQKTGVEKRYSSQLAFLIGHCEDPSNWQQQKANFSISIKWHFKLILLKWIKWNGLRHERCRWLKVTTLCLCPSLISAWLCSGSCCLTAYIFSSCGRGEDHYQFPLTLFQLCDTKVKASSLLPSNWKPWGDAHLWISSLAQEMVWLGHILSFVVSQLGFMLGSSKTTTLEGKAPQLFPWFLRGSWPICLHSDWHDIEWMNFTTFQIVRLRISLVFLF